MAYISKITPLGSNTAYDIKAKLVHHTDFLDTSNWQQTITYHKATDYTATYPPGYGYHNTGDTNGAFTIIPYETNTQPWGGTEGLYIGKTAFKWENNTILHSGNYTTYLNDVYVKKSGDTMTGSLTVSSTSPHLYLKNTSWTKGTNPTANSYSAVEFTANNGTGNKNRISLLETTVSTSGNSLLNIYLVPNVEDSTSWSGIVLSKTPANVLSISLQGATTVTGNVNPSADNTYTLGTSGVKWKNVYATTFTGSLSGNASTASALTDIASTDSASSTATQRRIWFCYDNNTTGRPAYDDNFTYQTSTKTLSVNNIKITRALKNLITGTGTAGSDAGSGDNRYKPARWTFNTGANAADGEIFTIKIPVAGHDYGVYMSVNNGTNYYPVVLNGTGRITTHYGNGTYLQVIFEPTGSATNMYPLAGGTSRQTVTGGVFRVINYYDSNTNTLLRVYSSATDLNVPLIGQSSANSTTAAWSTYTGTYKDWYGAIPNDDAKRAKINLSTGMITAPGGITGNLTGNASSASTVNVTETTPSSNTSYYLTYATGKSGNQTLRANADLYYYDTGTTSYLNVGSSSNSGGLTLHNANGKLGNIVSSAFTENRTFTLPDKTGTIALTSDLVDTKVTQTALAASGYSNWRTLLWGASNSGTEGFTPATVTDQVYSTDLLTVQPSTGTIRAKNFKAISGNFTANNTGYGLYLKDSAGTSYAGIYDNGANLWVGASSSEGNHHKGSTFISTGYGSDGTTGNLTAYISIPTKSGTTVTHTGRAIAHVITAGSATKPVYADSNGALKPITSYEGNAASATKVYITANSATSGSSYYPTFTTASTSGNQDLKNDTRFYIYDAASSGTYLNIGNSTNSGFLRLWNSNGKNAKIETSAFTDNRTFTLPNKTGTIALTSDSAPAINGVYYGVCSTDQAIKTKTVTLTNGTNFALAEGCLVAVKFTNASAAATMTLDVNGTGAKNLCMYGTTTMSSTTHTNGWRAGAVVLFVYDGTQWERVFWENTTYWNESIYVSTAASTAAKVGNGTYTLEAGKYFQVLITNANTAASALTLNINNKGAKPIYINGAASSTSNYTLPQGYYLVYYDGTNYHFRTDSYIPGNIAGTASNVRGTVAIANGGTGKTTAAEAWTALGGGSVGKLNYGSGTTTYLRNDGTWAAPASDHKVTQGAAITTAGAYPIILATSTATTEQTNTVNKTSTLTYNPSTTKLHTPILEVTTASYGETLPSSGTAGQLFFQTSSGGMYELPTGGTIGQALIKNSANNRDVVWGTPANATTAVNATNAYTSASTAKAYIVGATTDAASFKALVHNASVYTENTVLFGAAWNDYAEFRKDNQNEIQEPGRCVAEQGDGALALTTQRLQRGCEIISDTFGFAIGQDEENGYNTPIAVSGRALAYIYEGREAAIKHIGWPVCSGPNGTVSIMTEEEEEKYPSRIIGTISEIPNYEYWGAKSIAVKERVWIRIK